ncbi:MAG TPA: indole-3-glycerol phosphate synthase TrpC, partial [Acidobacteriaceae bacterium]|nr:indole-3-glycerol phosphate synthase TrpC [Acidobacteriaceae bacterium]
VILHLDRILSQTRADLERRKAGVPIAELERRAAAHTPRGFAASIRRAAASGPAIIAELKKASPSKGLIRPDFHAEALARELENAGAAALSVLTDEPFFQGSLHNLETASEATRIPCLRKDFVVDEYQIVEALAYRADAILLIVAALSDSELARLTAFAHQQKLDVLCEVHTAEELARARDLGCDAYGVNNRDLRSFQVSLETSLRLAEQLPANAVHVAESGIETAEDIRRLREVGFDAFLIGESLMRQQHPGAALVQLISKAQKSEAAMRA